jgi:hypothetical protein
MNLYGFGDGDPINFSDPFGLCKENDINCRYLVSALRQQGRSAFTAAAQRYDDLRKGVVSFIAISQLGAWNQSLGVRGMYNPRTENVWLVGESSRADFLLTAVHEALHMGGIAEDDPALAQGVYDAYMQMPAKDRATATWTKKWLQERGKLEDDKQESTTTTRRDP